MPAPALIVVTPAFEDVQAASRLFAELAEVCGPDTYVIAVDDGSVAQPVTLGAISASGLDGVILRLVRNVGHQRAIAIGVGYAAEQFPDAPRVVVMDCDGEDVPATIPMLLETLADPQVDVAVAERKGRVETLRFRLFYVFYKLLFELLTGRRIRFGNFMAMNATGLRRLASMGELGIHVAGTVLLSRLRWKGCLIDRGPRYTGHSKMNFVSLSLHGFKGLMVFAEDVLVRVGATCALVAGMSVAGISAAIVLKSIGYATPGWFSVTLGILLLVFLQTGAITLMTLLLTGVTRSALLLPGNHRVLIDTILATKSAGPVR